MKKALLAIVILQSLCMQSQTPYMDSCITVYNDKTQADSIRLDAIHRYSWQYRKMDFDSSRKYALMHLALGKKAGNAKHQARAHNTIGISYLEQGKYQQAQAHQDTNVRLMLSINDTLGAGYAYGNLANSLYRISEFEKAIVNYELAADLFEKAGRLEWKSLAQSQCGLAYKRLGEYPTAIEYIDESYKTAMTAGDTTKALLSNTNLANLYEDLGENETAKKMLLNGLAMARKVKAINSEGTILANLGNLHYKKEEFNEALNYYYQSLAIKIETQRAYDIAHLYSAMGNVLTYLDSNERAESFFYKAYEMDKASGNGIQLSQSSRYLATLYYDAGNMTKALKFGNEAYKSASAAKGINETSLAAKELYKINKALGKSLVALKYYEEHIALEDSIQSEANKKKIIRLNFQNEYDRKHLADSLAFAQSQELKEIEHNTKLEKEQSQRYILYAGVGFLLIIGAAIFRGYYRKRKDNIIITKQKTEVEHQKLLVEEKNQEILDSITYAKRIQSAILPPDKLVKEYLQKSFILYKPKDIVAGDFYWMEHAKDMVLFAAADCTGHGVPGAMVSVVCNNGLNRSVREHGLTNPGKILDKTREIVVQEFEKSEEEVKDGMDIALCSLNGNTLHYAGAHNPLWIIRSGAEEIEEIKADKQPIGKTDNPTPYTTHKVDLKPGDTIYIFSDGYADQFGGEKGKKLKTVNFKKLLLSIKDQDMTAQKQSIDEAFENWKGELEQLDDVCVIGVRV